MARGRQEIPLILLSFSASPIPPFLNREDITAAFWRHLYPRANFFDRLDQLWPEVLIACCPSFAQDVLVHTFNLRDRKPNRGSDFRCWNFVVQREET